MTLKTMQFEDQITLLTTSYWAADLFSQITGSTIEKEHELIRKDYMSLGFSAEDAEKMLSMAQAMYKMNPTKVTEMAATTYLGMANLVPEVNGGIKQHMRTLTAQLIREYEDQNHIQRP